MCLEALRLDWRSRCRKWNELKDVRSNGWEYETLAEFTTDVHHAEEQLTGSNWGLRAAVS